MLGMAGLASALGSAGRLGLTWLVVPKEGADEEPPTEVEVFLLANAAHEKTLGGSAVHRKTNSDESATQTGCMYTHTHTNTHTLENERSFS